MSYILDALRKADRERDRSRVPSLTTIHTVTMRPRWGSLPWLATGLALAGMGVTGWLIVRAPVAQPVPPAPAVRIETPRPPAPTQPLEAAASPAREFLAPPPSAGSPAPRGGETPLAARSAPPTATSRRLIESRRPLAAPEMPPPAAPRSVRAAPPPDPPASTPAPQPRVAPPAAPIVALPIVPPPLPAQPSAQEAMAKLTISILVHTADKADRLVYINGRRYGEGDMVDGLYLVQAIQPDGVLLTYQGEEHFLRAPLGAPR